MESLLLDGREGEVRANLGSSFAVEERFSVDTRCFEE
jgi:hypothetical protein